MEYGSQKGAALFTLAIGAVVVLGALFLLPRLGASEASRATASPTRTAAVTPTPTPPNPDALHSKLVSRSPDATVAIGSVATLTLTFSNIGTATWTRGSPSEARL